MSFYAPKERTKHVNVTFKFDNLSDFALIL